MQPKKICDECGKEIVGWGDHLYGSKWSLFGLLEPLKIDADFCSIKCLKEFVSKLK